MIEDFDTSAARDTGVVYRSSLNRVMELIRSGEESMALDVAVSALQLALGCPMTTNNAMVRLMMEDTAALSDKAKRRYDDKVAAKREERAERLMLRDILTMTEKGISQSEIGNRLGISQSSVSKRLKVIHMEYPEMLSVQSVKNADDTQSSCGYSNYSNYSHYVDDDGDVDDNGDENENVYEDVDFNVDCKYVRHKDQVDHGTTCKSAAYAAGLASRGRRPSRQ